MTTEIIPYRFQARGGNAAAIISLNEVPLRREIIVEIDTQKMKVGDGTTHYVDLPYWGGGGGAGGWLTGTGVPSSGLGVDGDLYLRTTTGDVYQKAAGAWTIVANLMGPAGADGADGADGAPGPPGADGLDAPSITRTPLVFSAPLGVMVSDVEPTFKMMRLFRCEGDSPFRLRLYSTTAERDADIARPQGTDAPIGSGLLFEFIGIVGLLSANLSPVPVVYNNEATPLSEIAYILEPALVAATTVTLSVMEIQP
jgi:hypothetical protein